MDANKIAQEWRTIPIEIEEPLRSRILSMSVEEAWREISGLKNFSDDLVFPPTLSAGSSGDVSAPL